MQEPQTLAAQHPTEIYTLLGFTCTAIIGFLTMLYKRQNEEIKGAYGEADAANARLDEGQKAFAAIGEQLVSIGAQIKALNKADGAINVELDRICLDIKNLDHDLTIIQTEHKNCKRKPRL